MIARTLILCLLLDIFIAPGLCRAQEKASEWSGLIYSKYYVDLTEGRDNYNAFEYERLYLNFRRRLNDNWSLRLTSDIGRIESITSIEGPKKDDRLSVFMKYIYVERKGLVPGSSLFLGLCAPPTWSNIEKYWGYRSIQKTIFDYNGWGYAADIGVALRGQFMENKGLYHVMLANGPGYKHMETDKQKKIMGYLQYNLTESFHVSGYGDVEHVEPGNTFGNFYTFYLHFGLTAGPTATAGGELIRRRQGNFGSLTALSVYGNVRAAPRTRFLGRIDIIRPTEKLEKAPRYMTVPYQLLIVGIDFDLGSGVKFTPNAQIETGERKTRRLNGHVTVSF